jgi:hypothetical protein
MIERTAPKTKMFVSAGRLQGQIIQSSRAHLVVIKIRCNLFAFTHTHTHTHTQICMNAYIPHNISGLARKTNGTAAEAKCQENLPACHFGQHVSQPRPSITTPTLQGIQIGLNDFLKTGSRKGSIKYGSHQDLYSFGNTFD